MNIFTPKAALFDSHIERAKFLMIYRLTLSFTLVFLCLSITFYDVEINALISYLTALGLSGFSLIYLVVTKKYTHLFLFFAIAGSIISQFSCNFSLTTTHYVDFLWMMISALLAFVGMGKYWGILILVMNSIGIAFFIYVSHNAHLEVVQPLNTVNATGAYVELILAIFVFGYLMFQFMSFQNFSEAKLRKANIELANQNSVILAKNNENITLIKEIHHRVKNNLQIIISLLRLQQSEIVNEEARSNFTEAINRVMVMSSIHQRLYQEKEVSRIDLKSYLSDLAEDLKMIFQTEKKIDVFITSTYGEIDLKTLVPLGLLLNELISNSYKYAFNAVSEGEIKIDIVENQDKFDLIYFDNGTWREQESNRASFGLDLINILAEQLNGSFAFTTNETGTRYHFSLSKLA